MIRHLLTALLLIVSSLASARIGLDSQLTHEALEAAGLTGEAAPEGFSVESEEYGGLLFALSGTGTHEPSSLAAIATAARNMSGGVLARENVQGPAVRPLKTPRGASGPAFQSSRFERRK